MIPMPMTNCMVLLAKVLYFATKGFITLPPYDCFNRRERYSMFFKNVCDIFFNSDIPPISFNHVYNARSLLLPLSLCSSVIENLALQALIFYQKRIGRTRKCSVPFDRRIKHSTHGHMQPGSCVNNTYGHDV